jgi:putative heme-binding domain-containing protein
VRQAVDHGEPALNKRLEQVWGQINVSSADKQEMYTRYRRLLTPQAIGAADASRGRVLYEANCGKCHKFFGIGGDIGPDITGANRTSIDYWLENILEPNALIGRGYQMTAVLTEQGQSINGIVKEDNDDALTLQTATEVVIVPKADIEVAKLSNASLMPEGQLQPMTDQQVCDLIKYLTGPAQVPSPGN